MINDQGDWAGVTEEGGGEDRKMRRQRHRLITMVTRSSMVARTVNMVLNVHRNHKAY